MDADGFALLTINTGSSSLKTGVYRVVNGAPRVTLRAEARQIGSDASQVVVADGAGKSLTDQTARLADHAAALDMVLRQFAEHGAPRQFAAVGHRVVHGGQRYTSPTWLDADVVRALQELVPLAPDHLPQSIAAIKTISTLMPDVRQVACFDTSFHHTLPRRARLFALPRALAEQGIVRFGFHGLSCEYLVEQLRSLDPQHIGGRTVITHLGSGASMTAVVRGQSVDTSMGFTPTGGLVMSTRSGDLDPGVLVYLLRQRGYSADALDRLCNRESGLAGLSEIGPDMRELVERRDSDERAGEAVEMFWYQASTFLAGFAGAMGGLDTVVFAGGIGENAPYIRQQICAELEFLGVALDRQRNEAGAAEISSETSSVRVRVIKTDEDLMIARHTQRLVASHGE